MKQNRIGCLTPLGIFFGIATLLAIAVLLVFTGGSMFSPGALNAQPGAVPVNSFRSHAEFGATCRYCHAPFWSSRNMADLCMDCHQDVRAQLTDTASLHGSLLISQDSLACRDCHPDHRGPAAALTEMDPALFPHDKLGFSLQAHQTTSQGTAFTCSDCHPTSINSFDPLTCVTCHTGVDASFTVLHIQDFGQDCLACHDGLDTYGSNFNHAASLFPLEGLHAGAACRACHINALSLADLRLTPTDCATCHAADDAHQGRYGLNCAACHTTSGWKPAGFDHDLSIFKLDGRHVDLPCERCHTNGVYQGTPRECAACHLADDAHNGSFGTDCSLCHTAAGWKPATFDHNLASFKLEGQHAVTACENCHTNGVYKGTPADCFSCHASDDAHNGQFGRDCGGCHTANAWKPATFDHTSFPLAAGHAGLPCLRCHTSTTYTGLSTACIACHADPGYHAGMFSSNCATCHNTSSWYAPYYGPHPNSCDGPCIGHEGASCRSCHPSSLRYYTCLACHDSNKPNDGD